MTGLSAALKIYGESAREALYGLPRGALSILVLLAAHILLEVIDVWLMRPLTAGNPANGFLLGFVVALVHSGAVGVYLRCVEIGVSLRRRVTPRDITDAIQNTTYLWEVISVFFIFWIASMVMMPLGPIGGIAMLVATVIFNPMPEQIYLDRTQSLQLLQDGMGFMQRNWPEWLGFHLLAAVGLVIFGLGAGAGGLSMSMGMWMLSIFGPFCGFINAASMSFAEATRGPIGIVMGALMLIFVHFFMLMRGHVYQRLAKGSRRQREWQARMDQGRRL